MSQRPRIVVESRGDQLVSTTEDVTIGGRTGSDVVVDDMILADRHCRIGFDDGFRVRDLGSVTGTWIGGERAALSLVITDGCEIVIGATRIAAQIEQKDGGQTLTLDVKGQAFWWKKPGKGVFDNDPDQMVRAEVRFGRFPLLTMGNRLALVLGAVVLLAAIFVSAVMAPLADPGPLLPSHAFVTSAMAKATDNNPDKAHERFAKCQALADAQGCNVCHTTGRGVPAAKCLQCHADMQEPATRRHPFLVDGVLKSLPGVEASEAICVICHRDHQGKDEFKPASAQLVGKCERCHGDGKAPFNQKALEDLAPVVLAPPRQRVYATYTFPHDKHLAKNIACEVCHQIDKDVAASRAAGQPDDALRDDFAEVPFETCKQCHVPDFAAKNTVAADKQQLPKAEQQWAVRWHGTDEDGARCAQCHASSDRGGNKVFGPELRQVQRPRLSTEQYTNQRARYTSPTRLHKEQFAAHSNGKDCTECHLRGDVLATVPPTPRPFWHALHVANGSLQPRAGDGAAISSNQMAGCVSCHTDIATAKMLQPATQGGYHWPSDAAAQSACKECHREGAGEPLALRAVEAPIALEQQVAAAEFPHDVHVSSKLFGNAGSPLADGCFACHEFTRPVNGSEFELVPRTKAKAADCTQCHGGHDNIGGGSCQQCHPAAKERSNSFLIAAAVATGGNVGGRTVPAPPQRSWPGATPFSHLSPGHSGNDVKCVDCHLKGTTEQAKDLATVPVPDEAVPACRACHLQRQFHWR